MQIFSTITNLTKNYSNIVVALGTFDGVHVGHQNIIKQAIELAKSINGVSVVFTFSNHPLTVISPDNAPLYISDNRCKQQAMEELGVDILENVVFTKKFANLSPIEFMKLLQENFAPKYIVVGPNYTFGFKGEGTPKVLLKKSASYGFVSEIQPVVHMNHHVVSSTRIRNLLAAGKLDDVNVLLGRPFRISGPVIHGDERGRLLGFPTANMAISPHQAMLPNGVYDVNVIVAGTKYKGVANIGTNPTFNGINRHVEVHILEFKENIYEKIIFVEFLHKIRDEEKFSSIEELIQQIHADIKSVSNISDLH